jgi:hypothetical protein
LENKIAKHLYDLARDLPKSWRKLEGTVVRRDREQSAAGAVSSALYGAAFQIQASTVRAANNHLIQSPGAVITKHLQRRIWDLQPYGVGEWRVAPMNIHDEVLTVTDPEFVDAAAEIVIEVVESYRELVPLIGMKWQTSMDNWAGKSGGQGKEIHISPRGVVAKVEEDNEAYVEPIDCSELEDIAEYLESEQDTSNLESLI